jgi:3-oxoacyl-[acyl-carrier protein] reductase
MLEMKVAVIETFGGVDILINTAGVVKTGCLERTKPQDYDLMMDVNLRAPMILTQFFNEELKQSKGSIVNVSCDKGTRPEAGMIGYCMSKAGVEMLTKSTAMELAVFGVRVNAVSFSFVDTNFYRTTGLTEPELDALKNRASGNIPLQRTGTEVEVAKSIIFLTSEQ